MYGIKRILARALIKLFAGKRRGEFDALQSPRILVVRQDNRIGNLLFITPLLNLIKTRFPCGFIDIVVGGMYPDLLKDSADINKILCYDQQVFLRNPLRFIKLTRELRKEHYDMVFDAKRVFSLNNFMVTVLCNARFRVGFENPIVRGFYDFEVPVITEVLYEPDNLARLFNVFSGDYRIPPMSLEVNSRSMRSALRFFDTKGIDSKEFIVGIHPGGRGEKRWPVQNMVSLCKMLCRNESARICWDQTRSICGEPFRKCRGFSP
jgi:ADP-heptose:LPS heptosyltransferase